MYISSLYLRYVKVSTYRELEGYLTTGRGGLGTKVWMRPDALGLQL